MKTLYLILAIVGAVIPYLFFMDFIQAEGVDLPLFLRSLFVNGAAGGFSADLLVTSCVFWIYMFNEKRRAKAPSPALFIIINLTVGLSCAFPAYLYTKEKMMNE
jgi:hypothetical protein